jgi:hypothetical protein
MTPTKSHLAEALTDLRVLVRTLRHSPDPIYTGERYGMSDRIEMAVNTLTAYESEALTPVTDDAVREAVEGAEIFLNAERMPDAFSRCLKTLISVANRSTGESIYIKFARNGNIRQWQRAPFDGAKKFSLGEVVLNMRRTVSSEVQEAVEFVRNYKMGYDPEGRDNKHLETLIRAAQQKTKRWTREEILTLFENAIIAWEKSDEDLRSLQDVVVDALITAGVIEVQS